MLVTQEGWGLFCSHWRGAQNGPRDGIETMPLKWTLGSSLDAVWDANAELTSVIGMEQVDRPDTISESQEIIGSWR